VFNLEILTTEASGGNFLVRLEVLSLFKQLHDLTIDKIRSSRGQVAILSHTHGPLLFLL
jgi:hypothetical protein